MSETPVLSETPPLSKVVIDKDTCVNVDMPNVMQVQTFHLHPGTKLSVMGHTSFVIWATESICIDGELEIEALPSRAHNQGGTGGGSISLYAPHVTIAGTIRAQGGDAADACLSQSGLLRELNVVNLFPLYGGVARHALIGIVIDYLSCGPAGCLGAGGGGGGHVTVVANELWRTLTSVISVDGGKGGMGANGRAGFYSTGGFYQV